MLAKLKKKLGHNPRLKQQVLHLLVHPVKTRPRRWLRLLQPFYLKRSKGSIICGNVRKDLVPFNAFQLGAYSVIESFSTINNMVGAVIIGNHSRIGLSNTVIGPVTIGNQVNLAQNIVISGLNHNYRDITQPISKQGVTTIPVTIEDDVWIGANARYPGRNNDRQTRSRCCRFSRYVQCPSLFRLRRQSGTYCQTIRFRTKNMDKTCTIIVYTLIYEYPENQCRHPGIQYRSLCR